MTAGRRPLFRSTLGPGDPDRIRELVAATGFFHGEEVATAGELADDCLARGDASDYRFIMADAGGRLVGYACFGRIPGTAASWDVYWIAVAPAFQGEGVGQSLLARCEDQIRASGGARVYVDTSSRPQYAPTRAFYGRCGYQTAAILPDFYAPGDGKVIFLKVLVTR